MDDVTPALYQTNSIDDAIGAKDIGHRAEMPEVYEPQAKRATTRNETLSSLLLPGASVQSTRRIGIDISGVIVIHDKDLLAPIAVSLVQSTVSRSFLIMLAKR